MRHLIALLLLCACLPGCGNDSREARIYRDECGNEVTVVRSPYSGRVVKILKPEKEIVPCDK